MFVRNFEKMPKGISMLGFGCMRLPQNSKERTDINFELAEKMVDYAYKNNVNYFDTAYPYHDGVSETFIGKALKKYPRESFYLANKLPVWLLEKPEDVDKYFNEQLEKCQVDYFDFYLVHSLDEFRIKQIRELKVVEILKQKQKEGKIKYLGFSFHDKPKALQEVIDEYEWDFCQLQVNYLDWELQDAKTQYEIVKEKNIPCIIMEPVRGGALANLSEEAAKILKAQRPQDSVASWAVRWVAGLENVITVLSGMSNMEQLEDNLKTLSEFTPISKEEQICVDKALKVYKDANTVPCTACKYCMPCPFGVDIPGVFKVYNEYKLGKNDFQFSGQYAALGKEHQASNCTACGKCVPECPQHIAIPDVMKEINNMINK